MNWYFVLEQYTRLAELKNLLPIASHCSKGVKNCTNDACPVGLAMVKKLTHYREDVERIEDLAGVYSGNKKNRRVHIMKSNRVVDATEKSWDIKGNDSGFEKVELPADMINQPSHYNYGEIECIDAIKGMLGEEGFKAYCRGNAMKYTWRAGLKFDEVEDLKKASWYNRMAAGDDPRLDDKPAESLYKIEPPAAGRSFRVVINTKTGAVRSLTEAEQRPGAVTKLEPDEHVTMQFIP